MEPPALKTPETKSERRRVMPITSEFCEVMYRAYEGLHSFRAVEAGYEYEWQREGK